MNTDHIEDIITALKEDKGCHPYWRNKAIARLLESIAFVDKGHKQGNPLLQAPQQESSCICPAYPAAIDATCPVHGR